MATEYITDLKIITGKNALVPNGFTKIPQNLNEGTKGGDIYLCYKKSTTGKAISKIAIAAAKIKEMAVQTGFTQIGEDLNKGAGGDYIYLYCKKGNDEYDTDCITDIVIVKGKNASAPDGYERCNVDLNKGSGGEYLYLCYQAQQKMPCRKYPNWMRKISDHKPIGRINIPGTHDSMMWYNNMECTGNYLISTAQTQYLTIENQFEAGVRSFDLRMYWSNTNKCIGIAHVTKILGSYIGAYSNRLFRDAIATLVKKLKQNPSEFVIVNLSLEQDISSKLKNYQNEVYEILKEFREYIYIDKTDDSGMINRFDAENVPLLGAVRGKMYIVSDVNDGSKGKLTGGCNNDPWRCRFKTDSSKIEYIKRWGNSTNFPKYENNECITTRTTYESNGNSGQSDRVGQLSEILQNRNNTNCLVRFGVNRAWDVMEKTPRQWSMKENPSVLNYIKKYFVDQKCNQKLGMIQFDFLGYKESESAAEIVILSNPELHT